MRRHALWILIGLLAAGLISSCGDETTSPKTVDQLGTVRSALDTYLNSAGMTATMSAQALFDNLNDGNTANDPYVLSVRSATDYAKGHIPGAHNVSWREIADPTKLAGLPTDRQIVVYCYTAHTGAVATTCLNAMGYDAVNLRWGIMAWTRDATVRVASPFNDATDAHDYPIESTVNTLTTTYELPSLDVTSSKDPEEIVRAAAAAYTGDSGIAPTISAQAVFDNLNDGNAANDYFVISVRSAADYAKGHIPGAYNIPYKDIAKMANLEKLPTDKTIVVYCYTGHTAGIATTALRMMGYSAVNMKFGIMTWTRDATARVASPFNDATDAHDYTFNTGTNP